MCFPIINVGNIFRLWSHIDLRRLLAVRQLPVVIIGKRFISDSRHSMYFEELLLFSFKCFASKSTLDELSSNDIIVSRNKRSYI